MNKLIIMQHDVDEMRIYRSRFQRIGAGGSPVEYNCIENFSESLARWIIPKVIRHPTVTMDRYREQCFSVLKSEPCVKVGGTAEVTFVPKCG